LDARLCRNGFGLFPSGLRFRWSRASSYLRLALNHRFRPGGTLAIAGNIQHEEQNEKGQQAD
jgi:hypothetical protein